MEFKKRDLLLLFFASLPFYNLFYINDYCFGVADLLVITGFTIVFVIAFLVVTFYDLYNISIKKLRFNFVPLLIAVVFSVSLFFGVKYQGKFMFKSEEISFKNELGVETNSRIILFTDKTFELKQASKNEVCTQKGTYILKNDTLYLDKKENSFNDIVFDSIYSFNKKRKLLSPLNKNLLNYKVE